MTATGNESIHAGDSGYHISCRTSQLESSSSLLLSRPINDSRRMVNCEVSEHWKWGSGKCVDSMEA